MKKKVLERTFRSKVVKFLREKGCDVWPFERCGYGCPDLMVVPKDQEGGQVFFIELKGVRTSYSTKSQQHQDDFKSEYAGLGFGCLKISPGLENWQDRVKMAIFKIEVGDIL